MWNMDPLAKAIGPPFAVQPDRESVTAPGGCESRKRVRIGIAQGWVFPMPRTIKARSGRRVRLGFAKLPGQWPEERISGYEYSDQAGMENESGAASKFS